MALGPVLGGRGLFLGVVRVCDLGPQLGSDRPTGLPASRGRFGKWHFVFGHGGSTVGSLGDRPPTGFGFGLAARGYDRGSRARSLCGDHLFICEDIRVLIL
jgi:hypothetical protein